ncbi:hypothetical protein N2152v2_007045 [Parachlorella kessleri]
MAGVIFGHTRHLLGAADGEDPGITSVFSQPDGQGKVSAQSTVPSRGTFTNSANQFYRGPNLLGVQIVGNADDCINLCDADARCELWSWCPLEVISGCEIVNFGDLAATATSTNISTSGVLPYGTCILSQSLQPGVTQYIYMAGDQVAWTGGYFGTPPAAQSQGNQSAYTRGVFINGPNRLHRGPTVLSVQVAGSAETCVSQCAADARCEQWSWCPLDVLQGCQVVNFGGIATTTTSTTTSTTAIIPRGTCILSQSMDAGTTEYIYLAGDSVAWTGGYFSSTPNAPSSPGGDITPPPTSQASPTPSPAAASPSPSPTPSPSSCSTCPCHTPPAFALPESNATLTVAWSVGVTVKGTNPSCYDVLTNEFFKSPVNFAPCTTPVANPDESIQEWAQTFCTSKPDEASKLFATAVLLGSTSAQNAVSALLYAQNTIGCFEGSTILDILSPPMSMVQGLNTAQTASNAIRFFTQVANASEQAGMGLCVVLFTTEGDSQASPELLATIHTGKLKAWVAGSANRE